MKVNENEIEWNFENETSLGPWIKYVEWQLRKKFRWFAVSNWKG